MADRQATFEDLAAFQYVRSLTATQINIIKLLEHGDYQAQIARRLQKSRSYVCQVVRKLESYGLVIARRVTFTHNGSTHTIATDDHLQCRATGYTITPKLKSLLAQNPHKDGSYTLCIPHHLKIKLPILNQNKPLTTTGWRQSRARAVHIRSWRPRGPERHLFHVETVGGTVGVEYHGSSLVAYRVDRTHLLANNVDEATALAAAQIQDGVARFIEEQGWAGIRITLGSPQIIDKPHFAFPSEAAKQVLSAGQRLTTPRMYCDNSFSHPRIGEIETTDPILATQIDQGLRNAINIEPIVEQSVARGMVEQSKVILDGFCSHLDPIRDMTTSIYETANTVLAHVQGGTTLEYQFTQLVAVLTHTLNELKELRDRVEELEQHPPAKKPQKRKKKQHDTKKSSTREGAPSSPGNADIGTTTRLPAQGLLEVRAGLSDAPPPPVSLRPVGSPPGSDPVCLPGLSRSDAKRREKPSSNRGKKKKR